MSTTYYYPRVIFLKAGWTPASVIADDTQTDFWTLTAGVESDDTGEAKSKTDSYKIACTADQPDAYHDYGANQDFSQYNIVSIWMKGADQGTTIKLCFYNEVYASKTNGYSYTITDNADWDEFICRTADFTDIGTPTGWSNIRCITLEFQDSVTGDYYFDELVAGVEIQSERMSCKLTRKISNPSSFEVYLNNTSGIYNSTFEQEDVVFFYVDNTMPPTTRLVRGIAEEIEIHRDRYMKNSMIIRGEDYTSVLAYRIAEKNYPGTIEIATVLKNLVDDYGEGEYRYDYVDNTGYNVVNPNFAREDLLTLMRKLAELPTGNSFDFWLDETNNIHFHLRSSDSYDTGVTLDGTNIRRFVVRKSIKDKKTYLHMDSYEVTEETTLRQDATNDANVTHNAFWSDEFTPTHDILMGVSIYIDKVGSPGESLIGRVAVEDANGDPMGDFIPFTIREEDVSTTADWVYIHIGAHIQRDKTHHIRLDRRGVDASNTYRWYSNSAATEGRTSSFGLSWSDANEKMSMKVHYGTLVDSTEDSGDTPKREDWIDAPGLTPTDIAEQYLDRAIAVYASTFWTATLTIDAQTVALPPGHLITLNESESGLSSKTYRINQVTYDFGPGRGTHLVELEIGSDLPYESMDELIKDLYRRNRYSLTPEWVGSGGTSTWEYAARIDTARIDRSRIGRLT